MTSTEKRQGALRDRFLAGLRERFAAIEARTDAWLEGRAEVVAELGERLHALASAAHTFDCGGLSEAASRLDRLVAATAPAPSAERAVVLRKALESLREAVESAAASAGEAPRWMEGGPPGAGDAAEVLVALGDRGEGASLARQLRTYGYAAGAVTRGEQVHAALAGACPRVLVAESSLPDGELAGFLAAAGGLPAGVALVIVAAEDGLEPRLAAVRAGASGFIVRPPAADAVVALLERVTAGSDAPPRVLSLDDAGPRARAARESLAAAGMTVRSLARPERLLERLAEFQPDLLLLGAGRADCPPVEVARALRLDERFAHLPLVGLDCEPGAGAAVLDGVHDPAAGEAGLVALVERVVRNARRRGEPATRDPLTGLPAYSEARDRLSAALARAERSGAPLSVGMLDLDYFQAINDAHGHAVGDRLIRALGRLLQRRLRRGDVIGRLGGATFVVGLVDTGPVHAAEVFDDLRHGFGRLRHRAEGGEFAATVSVGLAAYPYHGDLAGLLAAADEALYRAKRGGRNRVIVNRGEVDG